MKKLVIAENDSGQRIDKFILKTFPYLPKSLMFKEIRKKNIKINKKRVQPSEIIKTGDIIELYINDDVLKEKKIHYDFLNAPKLPEKIYEDNNIILLNKPQGMLCHPDGSEYTNTLIAALKRYLFEKGEWKPKSGETFTPALANRIDRNTAGIVIAAKKPQALKTLNEKIKAREIEKYYLAIVCGKMESKSGTLKAFLTKNNRENKVYISNIQSEKSKEIITEYKVLAYKKEFSLIEIKLETGRTHQIRAQMAHIGHPLLNDGKYGKENGRFRQALCSYKIVFNMNDGGVLDYLNHKTFELKNCEIYDKFNKL